MTPSFDLARYQDPVTIQRVIHGSKTIAIVGLSKNHLRASYFVGYYLRRHGYRVIPVNPREKEVLGEISVDRLTDVTVPVDAVRPSQSALGRSGASTRSSTKRAHASPKPAASTS